jgi:hypothetical protein
MGAGLGLKDCAPFWPVILTVVALLEGVLVVGAGVLGALELPPLPPLQPHAAKTKIAQESNRNRMSDSEPTQAECRATGKSFMGRNSGDRVLDLLKPYRLTFFRRFQLSIRYFAR